MEEKSILTKLDEVINMIGELNQTETEEKKMADLCSENESLRAEVKELKEALEKALGEKSETENKNDELEKKAAELEKNQLIAELNSELAKFTDDQRAAVKPQIDAFVANPLKSEINSIVAAVKIAMADRMMAEAKIITEQNAFDNGKSSLADIYGSMDESTMQIGKGGLY